MKKLKKLKLDEKQIISRLSKGEMKHLVGGEYNRFNNCLAGCGCGAQTACGSCNA